MERNNDFKKFYTLIHILVHHEGIFGSSRRFTDVSEFQIFFKDTPIDEIRIVWVLYKSIDDLMDLYVQYQINHSSEDDSLWQVNLNNKPFTDFHCNNIQDFLDTLEDHLSNP
jgi:hypothetical protein